jgi:hypothetical protein
MDVVLRVPDGQALPVESLETSWAVVVVHECATVGHRHVIALLGPADDDAHPIRYEDGRELMGCLAFLCRRTLDSVRAQLVAKGKLPPPIDPGSFTT